MTSRLGSEVEAVRLRLNARMSITGPPGSGKTRTALIIATHLAQGGPILGIDTEKESMLTYADDFAFRHLTWRAPFDPRELAETVLDASGKYAAVIVDSASHFWRAEGGTLDIAEGKFTGWKVARPAQDDMVAAFLACEAHVILGIRAKMKHEQSIENGKHVVTKLGMGPIQSDELEYELNVALDIDMGHRLAVSKSRCSTIPVGREFRPGHAEEFAEIYGEWLDGGEPLLDREIVATLMARFNALPESVRKLAKQDLVASVAKPDNLRESQLDAAYALVEGYEAAPDDDAGGVERESHETEADPDYGVE